MKNKKIKKILFSLIIGILILIILILIIIVKFKDDINQNNFAIKKLTSNEEYYIIQNCVQEYITNLSNGSNNTEVLDKWYIKNNELNSNIDLKYFNNAYWYIPDTIEYISKDNIKVFFVYGNIIINEDIPIYKEFNTIVKLDYNTNKYSIIPCHFEGMKTNHKLLTSLTDKKYKTFQIPEITDETIVKRYFNDYIHSALTNVEESYNMIDDEYKKIRFENNVELYKKYIIENYYKEGIPDVTLLTSYNNGDYRMYLLEDSNEKNYIIKETAVNEFSIFLDRYTVNMDFIDTYYKNKISDDKLIYNYENITDSLRTGYCEYIYNHLSTDIKNTQFKTLEEYKIFSSKNELSDYKKVRETSIEKHKDIYTYMVEFTNEELSKTKKVIIDYKLKGEMDFEILDIKIQ